MAYVDGFVLPVAKKKLAEYRRLSKRAGKVWRDHGALEFRECAAADLKPEKSYTFPQSVKLKPGETVFFSWIVYKSKSHRDRVNANAMKDPRLADMMDHTKIPFDPKRMIWGGFNMVVSL